MFHKVFGVSVLYCIKKPFYDYGVVIKEQSQSVIKFLHPNFLIFLESVSKYAPPDGSPNPPHSLPIAPSIVALYDGTADLYE